MLLLFFDLHRFVVHRSASNDVDIVVVLLEDGLLRALCLLIIVGNRVAIGGNGAFVTSCIRIRYDSFAFSSGRQIGCFGLTSSNTKLVSTAENHLA